MSTLALRERTGPYWGAWEAYVESLGEDGAHHRTVDYVPDWFLVRVLRTRLAAAQSEIEDLLPPARNALNNQHVRETRVEFLGAIGALERLLSFVNLSNQPDPLGARERVLAALLGADPEDLR